MLSSSSSESRERTNSSGTDQELSPPTSHDNGGSESNDNNVVMGSPPTSIAVLDSSTSIASSQHVFAKPLPVVKSSSSSTSFSLGGGPGGGVGGSGGVIGGSPLTQFEMDSLSPSGNNVLSMGGTEKGSVQHPHSGVSSSSPSSSTTSSAVHHRLTLSHLEGSGSGSGGGLIKTVDASTGSLSGADNSLQLSLEEEEAPYLDMSMGSTSGTSPRSLIISESEEVTSLTKVIWKLCLGHTTCTEFWK